MSCSENKIQLLKVGTTLWPGYEPLYLGREKGYVNRDKFHLVEYLSASQVIQAFRNNAIDVAALTMDEVLILASEGFEPVVILVLDSSYGGDAIISNAKYQSLSELKGRKIGYESSALGAYFLSRALNKNNLTKQDIVLVPMNVNETERAIKSGKVDAVVTFEPARTRLVESGYREIFSSRDIPDEIVDVLVVRNSLLDKRRESLKSLVKNWFLSLEYFSKNRSESLGIMNKRLKLSDTGLLTAFDGIVFPSRNENIKLLGENKGEGKMLHVTNKLMDEMIANKLLNNKLDLDNIYKSEILNSK
jgi:NitT/TauT family transport system substrate-binding protein